MIPRGALDIDWSTLLSAGYDSLRPRVGDDSSALDADPQLVPCLSVRSGFDALLSLVNWPAGTEVLMSAVNIPAMATILLEHGLVPVPVDVSPSTLAPDMQQVVDRMTPKTRALLVAHLFGSQLDLTDLHAVAQARGLELWEDRAQGFHRNEHRAATLADVSFFSFGLIKTQTALGGGLIRFQCPDRAEHFRALQATWPQQSAAVFRRRILRALCFKGLGQPWCYTVVSAAMKAVGGNLDTRLSEALRGFRAASFISQLRQRLCPAQLRLLCRRLAAVSDGTAAWKGPLAADYRRLLPADVQIGLEATFPGHWVSPIRSQQPERLRGSLLKQGYDATVRGSQLRVIPAAAQHPEWTTPEASQWVDQLLYLPMHPALTPRDTQQIAAIVVETERLVHGA